MSILLEKLRNQVTEVWALPWRIVNDDTTQGVVATAGELMIGVSAQAPHEVSAYLCGGTLLEQSYVNLVEGLTDVYRAFQRAVRVPPPGAQITTGETGSDPDTGGAA